jgi:hypothetical protein
LKTFIDNLLAQGTQATQYYLMGLFVLLFSFALVYGLYRLITGHAHEDYLTPREVYRVYILGQPLDRDLARNTHEQNRKASIILIISFVLALVGVCVTQQLH